MTSTCPKRDNLGYDDSYKMNRLLNTDVDFTYYGKMYQVGNYKSIGRKDIVFNGEECGDPVYSASLYVTTIMEWNNPISSRCFEGYAYDINSLKLLIDSHKVLIKEMIARQFTEDHPECLYK